MPADHPRPGPPPGRTAAPRPPRTNNTGTDARPEPRQQIGADQYIRLQAARISADYHRSRGVVKDSEILDLAASLERFIRTGKTGD